MYYTATFFSCVNTCTFCHNRTVKSNSKRTGVNTVAVTFVPVLLVVHLSHAAVSFSPNIKECNTMLPKQVWTSAKMCAVLSMPVTLWHKAQVWT